MKKRSKSLWALFIIILLRAQLMAQTVQTITGHVYDEASKTPLTGVVVSLIDTVVSAGTVTDLAGNFKLTGISIGRRSFRVAYMGYEDRIVNDIIVTAGKEVNLNVGMQEALHQMREVTVSYNKAKDKTRTNNDMAQVSARSFNVDETKKYAGALGDPSRMAANFAGVVSGNDSRNDIVVRGNSPTGMLWQLEGMNIPNPNHYGSLASTGGPVSMLNNNNIDKSDFLTSAFPAQYGNALAGVFDIRLRDGNKDKSEFMGQLGFNGFEFGAEGPLGKKKQTSYLVNYRYSALSLLQKVGVNFGTGGATPTYQDINYKITTNLTKKSKLRLFGIAGASNADFLGKDVDSTKLDLYGGDPYVNSWNTFTTTATGIAYENQLSTKTFTRLTLGYSTTFERYDEDSISAVDFTTHPDFHGRFTTDKMSGIWTVLHKMNAKNNVEGGLVYDRTSFNLLSKSIHGAEEEVYINSKGQYGLAQAYLQWKHRYSGKLSSVVGIHSQYLTINNNIVAEPRASIRYAFTSKQAISAGYGLHHQAQNIYTYYVQTSAPGRVQTTNKQLGFTASQHFVVTYDNNITSHLRLKAEAYYQALSNVPVERTPSSFSVLNTGAGFGPSETDSLVGRGKGSNYGCELTLERFFDRGFYFLTTASLFQSRYTGSDGIERNTAFNTGHVFNALVGKEFKLGRKGSVLALNLKVSDVGGRYLTPIDLQQSREQRKAVYITERAFTQKQPDYFRTDLKVAYRKEFKRSTLEMAIDLQNLTNHQNIFNQYYDVKKAKIITNYQQSFFPVPTIRFTF